MLWHFFLRVIFVIALVLLGLERSLMFLFDCAANGTIGLRGAAGTSLLVLWLQRLRGLISRWVQAATKLHSIWIMAKITYVSLTPSISAERTSLQSVRKQASREIAF